MGERTQVALQVALVLIVLGAAVAGIVTSVASQPPEIAGRTFAPPDASLIAATLRSPTATPAPTTPAPTPSFATLPPSPSPTASLAPIVMQPYTFNGNAYTGVVAPVGTVFVAPSEARVEVIQYQIIDGEFRAGTDLSDRPHYPYVILYLGDRTLKFRPGANGTDTEVLVQSSRVTEGDPLFRIAGPGKSSWHYRYDATVGAQVIVSLETPGLQYIDAKPLIRTR
jgi:hypothetical protein